MSQVVGVKHVLFIDTSSNEKVTIGIEKNGIKDQVIKVLDSHRDQVILPLINELLSNHHLTLNDLTEISVHTGPGSFTGIRVGVAIANALSYALHIPINGGMTAVEPIYS
jgi:tRNA threonylcarbamoyl adenosine modification protein YeaZ